MEGLDYHEIFSPVVKLVSICIVLALVALLDLELEQLDVKTYFLHGDLDGTTRRFCTTLESRLVCKLKKSLYGLKQSPRKWYMMLDSFMVSQGYTRSEYDHCLYFKRFEDIFIIYVLYVDDILIVSKIMDEINRLKAQMARTFDMKDLGVAKQILGIEIHRDKKNGKLSFS